MHSTKRQIDNLNSLLRGELAATETYQQAMDKAGNENWATELRRLHEEHRAAANALREHIHFHGGKPDQGSGAWGTWAKTVEGTAKLFGNTAALKALKEGEEHGIKSYEDALQDQDLEEDCKTLIRGTLLPRTRSHVPILDGMMNAK
jgi:uncharacterized protein (TIGR02284 family)